MSLVKLSKKHGLAPVMIDCFWCRESDYIAILGSKAHKLEDEYGNIPRSMITSYNPCPNCKAVWERGVVFLEVVSNPPQKDMPPIGESPPYDRLWFTGASIVVTHKAYEEQFPKILPDDHYKQVLESEKCLLDSEAFRSIFQDVINDQEGKPETG